MISKEAKLIVPMAVAALLSGTLAGMAVAADADVYGPPNLFKTMKTPFGAGGKDDEAAEDNSAFAPITVTHTGSRHLSLQQRLVPTRLYLPGKMVLGKSHEFTVKAKPGSWVAIAMADKASGAKSILGHEVRLGSDRKLVALGKIPDSGVINLDIETPVQGDLVGSCLYFEAAIWTKPDFSDLEFATPVRSENAAAKDNENGVVIAAEGDTKKGIKIVPNTAPLSPILQQAGSSLGNNIGKP